MLSRINNFALCAALICGSSFTTKLFAGGANTFTLPIVNVTFNPTTCSSLTPTAVTLNGQFHFSVHTTKNPDGTFRTKIQSEAHGTAVDNNGAKYVFNYNNHEQDFTSSPADAPPLIGTVTDRFQLTSKGSAPNLKVSFQIVFAVDASLNFTLITGVFKGDPNCDPI